MTLLGNRMSYKLSYRQQAKAQILTLLSSKGQYLGLIYFKNLPKIRMAEKCRNNNSNNNSDIDEVTRNNQAMR